MRRNLVRDYVTGKLTDVSERKMILWGAGEYSKRICLELQIEHVDRVIDSNCNKVGQKIYINDEWHTIESIDILSSLNDAEYFVFVGSKDYKDEIISKCMNITRGYCTICGNKDDYIREYDDLYEFFMCDPIICRKKYMCGISLKMHEFARKSMYLTSKYIDGEKTYRAISKGHGMVFYIVASYEEYVMHIPCHNAGIFRTDWSTNAIVKREVLKYKKILGLNAGFTIYEDDEGYLIQQKVASVVDWSLDNVKKVLLKIREIHESNIKMSYCCEIEEDTTVSLSTFLYDMIGKVYKKRLYEVSIDVITLLNSCEYVLCHNDLSPDNVVLYADNIEIIDWEGMRMGNRYVDICRFLVITEIELHMAVLHHVTEIMETYFGRNMTLREIRCMQAALIYTLYYEWLGRVEPENKLVIKEMLKQVMKSYGKGYIC